MELSYEQIKNLKSLSSDIIAKRATISDIDKMIENLTAKPEFGSAYLRSCQITVGDRKLGLSEHENTQVLALLEAARAHLTQKINKRKKEILEITALGKDRDQETEI